MPTTTYFRLEKDKKDKIIAAAKKEFSSVSIQDASIANIIKYAEIPRGSFYQYFSGKDDLFFYLFSLIRKEPEDVFLATLKEANGDIFETFKKFFPYVSSEVFEGEYKELYKNIFQHMNYTRSNQMMSLEVREEERKTREELIKRHRYEVKDIYVRINTLVNQEILKTQNEREFRLLIQQLWSMLFHSINEGFRMQGNEQKKRNDLLQREFDMKINWLQYGVSK